VGFGLLFVWSLEDIRSSRADIVSSDAAAWDQRGLHLLYAFSQVQRGISRK
jgi:hypothetical protein